MTAATSTINSERSQRTRRRLPAYGRKIVALRESGQAPTVAVLVVDGWKPITNLEGYSPWVVVVPDDEEPDRMDFGCLAGLFAFVFADRIERMDAIACAVLDHRPAGVFGWTDGIPALAYYVREAQ